MATRRDFIRFLIAASLLGLAAPHAFAKDDDGGSGGGGSNSGGGGSGGSGSSGGSDDGGSDNGGSDDHGSSNSGSGSSGSNSGSGSSNSGSDGGDDDKDSDGDDEQTHARKAVERGDAIALKKVLDGIKKQYPGRVVSVSLKGKGKELRYRIKVIDNRNRLLNLVVNARNGQITKAD